MWRAAAPGLKPLRLEEVPVTSLTYCNIAIGDTYGQAQVCSRVIRGVATTVHVSCLFVGKFWQVRNLFPRSIRLLSFSFIVRYWVRPGLVRVKFILDVLIWDKRNQRICRSHSTTTR